MPSITPRPAPPCSSETSRPGQPASTAVGHRSGSSPPSSASRAASTVLKRESAPRAASLRNSCSSLSAKFMTPPSRLALLGAQLGERDALVEPRLRRQPEHALADHVAQDLLGPARGLEPRQVGDELAPVVVGQPVGAEHVDEQLARRDRGLDRRHLGQRALGAGDAAALQRGQHPVAGEAQREEVRGDLAVAVADLLVLRGRRVGEQRLGEAVGAPAEALAAEPDRDALEHQRRQRDAPAAVDRPDLGARVERDVVEEDLVEVRLAGDLAQRPDRHALGVHRDDEHGQALVLGQLGVGAREQQAEGRVLRVRRPHLLAGEAPGAVLLLPGARLDAGEVGARGGLGEHLAPDLVGVEHRAEVALLLLLVAVRDQRRAEHADADDVEDPGHAGAADLLVDDDLVERAEALAAVLGRPRDGRPARPRRACAATARRARDIVAVGRLRLVLVEPGAHLGAVLGQLGGVVQVHGEPPVVRTREFRRGTVQIPAERRDHVGEARHRLRAAGVREPDDRRLHARLGQLAVAADVLLDRRRALALARLAGGDDPRGRQVRDRDLRRVAALRLAPRAQHGQLVAHVRGVAEQVAGVGVARHEPQRAPLAGAADEDRDPLLQRPRVARRLGHGGRAALEARRARAPHQRQQLERVLQQRVALAQRRERPAVELVLALEPARRRGRTARGRRRRRRASPRPWPGGRGCGR